MAETNGTEVRICCSGCSIDESGDSEQSASTSLADIGISSLPSPSPSLGESFSSMDESSLRSAAFPRRSCIPERKLLPRASWGIAVVLTVCVGANLDADAGPAAAAGAARECSSSSPAPPRTGTDDDDDSTETSGRCGSNNDIGGAEDERSIELESAVWPVRDASSGAAIVVVVVVVAAAVGDGGMCTSEPSSRGRVATSMSEAGAAEG